MCKKGHRGIADKSLELEGQQHIYMEQRVDGKEVNNLLGEISALQGALHGDPFELVLT